MTRREDILSRVEAERARQFNLPGVEFDVRNGPNDWIAIIGRYVFEAIGRGPNKPSRADFEDGLVKASAVMLAALEHCDLMQDAGKFA